MSKHTNGPWNIYFNSQDDFVIRKMFADGQESHVVARCHSGAADARLIAAAPELLSALQEVIAAADGKGWEQLSPSLENQRRAVEKALRGVRVK